MKIKTQRRAKGFTLIEVIVAVSIVIILATLAVPKVSGYLSKAKEAKAMSIGKQIYNAAMWSYADQGSKFVATNVSDAVKNTTNITLTADDVTVTDKILTVTYTNDSKDYKITVNPDTNNYTVTNTTDSIQVFSSTQ